MIGTTKLNAPGGYRAGAVTNCDVNGAAWTTERRKGGGTQTLRFPVGDRARKGGGPISDVLYADVELHPLLSERYSHRAGGSGLPCPAQDLGYGRDFVGE